MVGLNRLVAAGKVLYLGISDTPAWIVTQANQYARDHGLRCVGHSLFGLTCSPFVIYEVRSRSIGGVLILPGSLERH